jgi:hypothetical protein
MIRPLYALSGMALISLVSLATGETSATAARTPVCYSNADCGDSQFCDTDANAGVCGGPGTCTSRGLTLFCMNVDVQACGCDGKPYANACLAHKASASIDPQPFHDANVDGDTLAEQPWMDASQTHFYIFTGNGSTENDWGTFEERTEPACTRSTPRCFLAFPPKTGSFFTCGSTLELDYDDGSSAIFDATKDCHNTWRLVGDDTDGTSVTLTPSTIVP